MLSRLQRNAELYGINLDIRGSKVEELDLDDNSAEVIVSTQVLCYTNDLKQALSEVYRTLRPGGRLLFIEHIGAPEGTLLRRIQDLNLVRKPWRWWLEGCNLAYETDSALKTVGFSTTELEYHTTKTLMPVPIRHYIVGTATK